MNHEHNKFIASDPTDIIVRSEVVFQNLYQLDQDSVSRFMPVGVIDALKVVNVKEQHIGAFQINAGKQQIISGTIISAGQFIVRCFEIQTIQTAPAHSGRPSYLPESGLSAHNSHHSSPV